MSGKRMLFLVFLSVGLPSKLDAVAETDASLETSLSEITQSFRDIVRIYNNIASSWTQSPNVSKLPKPDTSSEYTVTEKENIDSSSISDKFLNCLREQIIKKGLEKLITPDISIIFKKKIGLINYTGEFYSRKGWVKKLSTIRRLGNSTVSLNGDDYVVSCDFVLPDLAAGYNSYKLKVWLVKREGLLKGVIPRNLFRVKATITCKNNNCVARLNDLHLAEFGGFEDFEVSGAGKTIMDAINKEIKYNNKVIRETVAYTSKYLTKKLSSFDCNIL